MAPTTDESAAETERIRDTYAVRDRAPARHPAIATAYRLVNADRQSRMEQLIASVAGSASPRLLDVGCGQGLDLAHWLARGWSPDRLAGVDVVEERIAGARARCPRVDLRVNSGAELPFDSGAFDVSTAVTVFSSILDPTMRHALFAEMRRVVRPGGTVLIYDFVVRNPRNRDVLPMTAARIAELGVPPDEAVVMTPLIHAVAAASLLGRRAASLAMRIAPRTHRIWVWRMPEPEVGVSGSVTVPEAD